MRAVGVESEDTLGLLRAVAPCAGAMAALLAVGIVVLGLVRTVADTVLIRSHELRAVRRVSDVDVTEANGFIRRAPV